MISNSPDGRHSFRAIWIQRTERTFMETSRFLYSKIRKIILLSEYISRLFGSRDVEIRNKYYAFTEAEMSTVDSKM